MTAASMCPFCAPALPEQVVRQDYTDLPCAQHCGRCSRCVRAEWVARHGDYRGKQAVAS